MWKLIFLANLAATLYMVGLIWFVQVVHYPLFGLVNLPDFTAYQLAHSRLTTLVVLPPMIIEISTALLLIWLRPPAMPLWAALAGAGLVLFIWAATFLVQVPQHNALALGFDAAAHRLLVNTNWLRTIAWTVRGGLLLWLTARLLA